MVVVQVDAVVEHGATEGSTTPHWHRSSDTYHLRAIIALIHLLSHMPILLSGAGRRDSFHPIASRSTKTSGVWRQRERWRLTYSLHAGRLKPGSLTRLGRAFLQPSLVVTIFSAARLYLDVLIIINATKLVVALLLGENSREHTDCTRAFTSRVRQPSWSHQCFD